jgi:hypothetical protein
MRMRKLRDGLRFSLQPLPRGRVRRKICGKDLDRNIAPQSRVARPVHLAHAARAQRRDDLIWTECGTGFEPHDCREL